jgi:hypothetical protein
MCNLFGPQTPHFNLQNYNLSFVCKGFSAFCQLLVWLPLHFEKRERKKKKKKKKKKKEKTSLYVCEPASVSRLSSQIMRAFLLLLVLGISFAFRTPKGGARIRRASHSARSAPGAPGATRSARSNSTGAPGVFGVDVSDPNIAASSWACMHTNGNYSFAIVECWRGGYQLSPCADNIQYAWAGGFHHVDVYSFMCPRVGFCCAFLVLVFGLLLLLLLLLFLLFVVVVFFFSFMLF